MGNRENLLTVENTYTGKADPRNAYKNWKRGFEIKNDVFVASIEEAEKKIRKATKYRDFTYFDGIGASLAEILGAISLMNRGDIILLEYIQKIPTWKEIRSGNPDLERIREGSEKLIQAAKIRECVIIAAAQFNREGYRGQIKDDEFSDADFRGCGDLEQDGHNLLGIGRSKDKTQTYYQVIKSREGAISDDRSSLDFAGGYSFMENTGQKYNPKKHEPSKRNESPDQNDDGDFVITAEMIGVKKGGKKKWN